MSAVKAALFLLEKYYFWGKPFIFHKCLENKEGVCYNKSIIRNHLIHLKNGFDRWRGGEQMSPRKLLCQRGPVGYWISLRKEYLLRDLKTCLSGEHYAKHLDPTPLPCLVKGHTSLLMRHLHGVEMQLQEGKKVNLQIAAAKLNGIIIEPGQTFSFWGLVGHPTEKEGYTQGLVIAGSQMKAGIAGGLCQLANMVHWLVLNSPMTVTELHHHSDALFPDERRTVPFGTGTSVFYKNIDYQFKNTTDQPVQLLFWLSDTDLCGELRTTKPFPYRYRIVEEDNHYRKEADGWYRISKVYRRVIDRESGQEVAKELVLDNLSRVMYDPKLIPPEQIRQD